MRRLLILAALMSACSSSTSTAPSTTTTPPVTTTPAPTPPVVITPPAPTRDPKLFSQAFWDQFVHNAFAQPGALVPLQRLPAAPMLYLKTVDEAGQPIDALTLQTVEDAMRSVASTWGGGQFGLRGVERGTSTKEGVGGWLTVRWPSTNAGNFCGRSEVGADGGVIELNYLFGGTCTCGASKVRPFTARHELGHAFGYYHTDSQSDVMAAAPLAVCDLLPSGREVYHATLAYQSPVGSTNALPMLSRGAGVIIVD